MIFKLNLQKKTAILLFFFTSIVVYAQERIAVIQEPFVILLDPADGTIIDPSFIDITSLNPGTPKGLLQVDDEIWITDQNEDRIDRFDLNGMYLNTIETGLDNIKGLEVVENEVWVTNAGSNNDAPGDAIVRFDFDGVNIGFFPTVGSTFDIIDVGGEVYVSYIGATTRIERWDYSGNVLGNIVEEGVVTFIQQMEQNTSTNSVFASVFSSNGANNSGLYEFAESDGTILNYYDLGALRGLALVDDGTILYSTGNDINILDPSSGNSTLVSSGGSSHYFGRVDLNPLSINDFNNSLLGIFPNPASDILNINYSATINSIAIINNLGQVVLKKQTFTPTVHIDVSTLADGMYIVNAITDDRQLTAKFIKK